MPPAPPMRNFILQTSHVPRHAARGPAFIAGGLAILTAAVCWPAIPATTGMALVALGATATLVERFRGTSALGGVVAAQLFVYGSLLSAIPWRSRSGGHVRSERPAHSLAGTRSGAQRLANGRRGTAVLGGVLRGPRLCRALIDHALSPRLRNRSGLRGGARTARRSTAIHRHSGILAQATAAKRRLNAKNTLQPPIPSRRYR